MAGALVVGSLGAFMLTLKPRLKANAAFAFFALWFGAFFVQSNIEIIGFHDGVDPIGPYTALRVLTMLAATGGLAWVALEFPTPLARRERGYFGIPLATTTVGAILISSVPNTAPDLAFLLGWAVMTGFLSGLPAFYGLRAARASSVTAQKQFALVAAAFAVYAGFIATAGGSPARAGSILDPAAALFVAMTGLAPMLLAAVLWLRAASRIEASRAARNVALLCAAMPLLGLVYVSREIAWGAAGLVRIAMVAILAYGIARHQLMGLDLKVRWTISKSTIAAVFIAVFFIASETAQQFFGDTLGSTYIGIAAAGLLVFAMAPLQRVAERLAEKAVPVAPIPSPASPTGIDSRERAYRHALEFALRDRVLSGAERVKLAHLSDELGLSARRAAEIETEFEPDRRGP